MKKVIRHKITGAFFAAGAWTADFKAAQKFTDMLAVLKACDQYQIADAEVILLMEENLSKADVALDLEPPRSQPAWQDNRPGILR